VLSRCWRIPALRRATSERSSAAGAAEALKLLLEVCTVRSMDDPRAGAVTTNLARAADQLGVAAGRIDSVFAASRDVASIVSPPPNAGE
jgi:hypothetical protein